MAQPFIIPLFLNCSTCFGQHTAHHQEPKNCNCSLWFYIRFWLLAAAVAQPFIIPLFLNCSTCFGRHIAHHQEPKNCNCSLWFYICFWLPAAAMAETSQRRATKNVCKPEAAITVFELLMMSGVSPKTC